MRRLFTFPLVLVVLAAACQTGDAPVAPRVDVRAAPDTASRFSARTEDDWLAIVQPYRAELTEASAGLLYTSESDYPFDYVSRPLFLRDTLTLATFRLAFGVARTTPVDVRTLDRFFAPHIERVDPNDPVSVALVPRYENLKFQLQELLDAPKVYCVGTIRLRCYAVGTNTEGVVAGLATTAIET